MRHRPQKKMNKKELAEIKKNFSEGSGLLTLNHILSAYVDAGKNIHCKSSRFHSIIPEDEGAVLMETLKKVLSGSIGKGLVEYAFPNEAYEEGGAQNTLYSLLRSKLKEDEATEIFLSRIVDNLEYESAYAIITGFCSYSILSRDRNDETSDVSDYEYNFILTAICPVNTGDDGLVVDSFNDAIFKKSNTEMVVSRAPTDGFLYPVFSDRNPDVNHVLSFTKTPNKPNVSMVNDVLGCEFVMSAQNEKETFQQVISDIVGDELDYTVITQVNEKIQDVIEQSKHETEPVVIDDIKLRSILTDVGVSEERLEALGVVYEESVGKGGLKASNLVETKTVIATPDITVNIKKGAADKVRTSVIQGRRCLVIDLDDPSVVINGLATTLGFPQSQLHTPEEKVLQPV